MDINEYRKLTIIMRGFTEEQADLITKIASEYGDKIVIEMTLNSDNAFAQIQSLYNRYGDKIKIGAGTVRNLEQLKKAHEHGAQFVLGPHSFDSDMFEYCKKHEIISVPSAMTPSEVNSMLALGADIVKVFPAAVVTPRFFKDIQGPLGKIPLMAVGGVGKENIQKFYENGAEYAGVGSSMFNNEDLKNLDEHNLRQSIKEFIKLIYG